MKKQRIHLKRRKRHSKKTIFCLTLIFLGIILFLVLKLLGDLVNPLLLKYSQIETERFASHVVGEAINSQLSSILKEEELFGVIKSEDGTIQTVDFNSAVVNKVLKLTMDSVYEKLKLVEEGKLKELNLPSTFDHIESKDGAIVCVVPMGVITGNSLLMNLGPNIPLRLGFVGEVSGNIKTNVKEYGINNALIEVFIRVEVTEQITMPLLTEQVPVSIDVPIAMKMVQGKIPTYYQNGLDSNSKIFSIPLE